MHFLPSPMLATGDKYKKFEYIYMGLLQLRRTYLHVRVVATK